jgi:hypothetical protein
VQSDVRGLTETVSRIARDLERVAAAHADLLKELQHEREAGAAFADELQSELGTLRERVSALEHRKLR